MSEFWAQIPKKYFSEKIMNHFSYGLILDFGAYGGYFSRSSRWYFLFFRGTHTA